MRNRDGRLGSDCSNETARLSGTLCSSSSATHFDFQLQNDALSIFVLVALDNLGSWNCGSLVDGLVTSDFSSTCAKRSKEWAAGSGADEMSGDIRTGGGDLRCKAAISRPNDFDKLSWESILADSAAIAAALDCCPFNRLRWSTNMFCCCCCSADWLFVTPAIKFSNLWKPSPIVSTNPFMSLLVTNAGDFGVAPVQVLVLVLVFVLVVYWCIDCE